MSQKWLLHIDYCNVGDSCWKYLQVVYVGDKFEMLTFTTDFQHYDSAKIVTNITIGYSCLTRHRVVFAKKNLLFKL